MLWILIIAVLVVALVAVVTVQQRRSPQSSVDSFRRQIDALGPEARRTVVDQVQTVSRDQADEPEPGAPSGDDHGSDPDAGGTRGA